jgi:hypothetical protein
MLAVILAARLNITVLAVDPLYQMVAVPKIAAWDT